MKRIKIVGLGPGNPDYLLPVCKRVIQGADLLIGGSRNIESLGEVKEGKRIRYIDRHLRELIHEIRSFSGEVVMVVSGDTGFYSMLEFMKSHFEDHELATYPGISSMQYLFARCNLSWFNALVKSVHGREFPFEEEVANYSHLGLLTDSKTPPQEIGRRLTEAGYGHKRVIVGENLSYEEEVIEEYTARELAEVSRKFHINAVIVEGDRDGTY